MRQAIWAGAALAVAMAGNAQGASNDDAPTKTQAAIYQALLTRDAAPDCLAVDALSPTLATDLAYVVQHAQQPAWASLRAASCLVERHPVEAKRELSDWVTHAGTRGLAIVVLQHIDAVPANQGHELAVAALNGPYAADARVRLGRSKNPDLQNLVK